MSITANDKNILRELAKKKAEIAALPQQKKTKEKWKKLNSLQPERPMVMIDQIPWHEMNVNDELTLKCENKFCRNIETWLRRTLYCWKHMPADMVVEPYITIPQEIEGADLRLGIIPDEKQAVFDPQNPIVGHEYKDQLENEEDLHKIKSPEIKLNRQQTNKRKEIADEIFDGILEVKMQGFIPMFAIWDRIVEWRGPENAIMDLAQRPEFMHDLLNRVTDAYHTMLDQLEEKGLLGYPQKRIHCTGAYTDELPAAGFDPDKPRPRDLWTCGMAQIFSTVSPQMHKEFEVDYAVDWYQRFGLVYYGCCEPLHNKFEVIKEIPNLRKISISPWADQKAAAEKIGNNFVFSRKPNPALLTGKWKPENVREKLEETLDICKQHNSPVELILKDISTVDYEPQRLWEWEDMARELVKNVN